MLQAFTMKSLGNVGLQRTYMNRIKASCRDPKPVSLSKWKIEAVTLKSATRQSCPLSTLPFNIVLESQLKQ